MPILSALLALSIMAPAIAAERKPVTVPTEPQTKRVRTVRIPVCEIVFTFEELWRCRVLP